MGRRSDVPARQRCWGLGQSQRDHPDGERKPAPRATWQSGLAVSLLTCVASFLLCSGAEDRIQLPNALRRIACLVCRTHDYRLQRGEARLSLRCRRCGVCTPGWEVGGGEGAHAGPVPPLVLFGDPDPNLVGSLERSQAMPTVTTARSVQRSSDFRLLLDERED
jgi:hypothetical protein